MAGFDSSDGEEVKFSSQCGEPLKKRPKTQVIDVFNVGQMREIPYSSWDEFHSELEIYSKATNQVDFINTSI
jgi:hypothetical protein